MLRAGISLCTYIYTYYVIIYIWILYFYTSSTIHLPTRFCIQPQVPLDVGVEKPADVWENWSGNVRLAAGSDWWFYRIYCRILQKQSIERHEYMRLRDIMGNYLTDVSFEKNMAFQIGETQWWSKASQWYTDC